MSFLKYCIFLVLVGVSFGRPLPPKEVVKAEIGILEEFNEQRKTYGKNNILNYFLLERIVARFTFCF